MAFVFRSEKKGINPLYPQPLQTQQSIQPLPNQQRQGSIIKGLAHQLFKDPQNRQKQNILNSIEAKPIHKNLSRSNNQIFKKRQFNDIDFCKQTKEQLKKISIQTVKIIPHKKLEDNILRSNDKNREQGKINSQSCKDLSLNRFEKPSIINKNLLKVMLNMSQNSKNQFQLQKIAINETKQSQNSNKNYRFKESSSFKKLSPLKSYLKNNQTSSTQAINLSCSGSNIQNTECQIFIQPKKEDKVKQKFQLPKTSDGEKQSESDESENQYMVQATPGPGAYSYDWNKKKQFRSKKKKFQKIFYSEIERFQQDCKKFQQVTFINDKNSNFDKLKTKLNKHSQGCQSFLSKSPKFKQNHEIQYPPPGYYNTRQTLQHDLVRNILKSSNSTTFISKLPRSIEQKKDSSPGPGAYTLDRSLQKLIEQKNKYNFSFKSEFYRNSNQSHIQQNQFSKMKKSLQINQKNSLIHVKQDSIIENYYLSQPVPFMSSSERFPEIKKDSRNNNHLRLNHNDLIQKPLPTRQPFNSSQKRQAFSKIGEGVGIGLYNLNKDLWSKKSYNILFN